MSDINELCTVIDEIKKEMSKESTSDNHENATITNESKSSPGSSINKHAENSILDPKLNTTEKTLVSPTNLRKRKAEIINTSKAKKMANVNRLIDSKIVLDLTGNFEKLTDGHFQRFFAKHNINNIECKWDCDKQTVVILFRNNVDSKKAWELLVLKLAKMKLFSLSEENDDPKCNLKQVLKCEEKRPLPKEFDFWNENIYSTYGLSEDLLHELDIQVPLTKWILVENMDCEAMKARHILDMAGKVLYCDFDENNKLKVMFDHPIEAVQAISMFNNREYNGKMLKITMCESKLNITPKGMSSIGPGFGLKGEPLPDVTNQMERIIKGNSSNIDTNILGFIPKNHTHSTIHSEETVQLNSIESHIQTPNESPLGSDGCNSTAVDFTTTDNSPSNDDKTSQSERITITSNESAQSESKYENPQKRRRTAKKTQNLDNSTNSFEVLNEKALVPQTVAENIVAMIKKGWTAFEIVNVLKSADSQRQIPIVKTGLQVLAPNTLNNMAVNQNINVSRQFQSQIRSIGPNNPSPVPQITGVIVAPSNMTIMAPPGPAMGHSLPLAGPSGPISANINQMCNSGSVEGNIKQFSSAPMHGSGVGSFGILRGSFGPSGPSPFGSSGSTPANSSASAVMWNTGSSNSLDPGLYTVQLSNLPLSITFPIIHEKMSMCGEVKFVKFTEPGNVLVAYGRVWEAEKCIQMFNKTVVDGHEVHVAFVRG